VLQTEQDAEHQTLGRQIVQRIDRMVQREDYKGIVFIKVGYREILCLHLYDDKLRVRKVIITYPDGEQVVEVLDSKDNVYYSPIGPVTMEVKKPKFMILR
jgi:hypothetical protein